MAFELEYVFHQCNGQLEAVNIKFISKHSFFNLFSCWELDILIAMLTNGITDLSDTVATETPKVFAVILKDPLSFNSTENHS